MGSEYIFKNTPIATHAYIASEYRYNSPKINQNTLSTRVYAISSISNSQMADTSMLLKSINSLIEIKSNKAVVIVNDNEIVVDPQEIVVNDIIIAYGRARVNIFRGMRR